MGPQYFDFSSQGSINDPYRIKIKHLPFIIPFFLVWAESVALLWHVLLGARTREQAEQKEAPGILTKGQDNEGERTTKLLRGLILFSIKFIASKR